MRQADTAYFEKGGKQHTRATLEAAKQRSIELGIKTIVVTSTTAKTALEAARIFSGTGVRLIAVPFQKHLRDKYPPPEEEAAAQCRDLGVEFLPDEPVCRLLDEERPDIVNAWRTVSQGFKVALQVAVMCVDTGLLEAGATVISVGGSGHGADTAVVIRTYGFDEVLKSNVMEIVAMPSA